MYPTSPKPAMCRRRAGVALATIAGLGLVTAPARADLFQVDATFVIQSIERDLIDCGTFCADLGTSLEVGDIWQVSFRIDTGQSTDTLVLAGRGFSVVAFRTDGSGAVIEQRTEVWSEPRLQQLDDLTNAAFPNGNGPLPNGGPNDVIGFRYAGIDPFEPDEVVSLVAVMWGAADWFISQDGSVDAAALQAAIEGGSAGFESESFAGTPDASNVIYSERVGGNMAEVRVTLISTNGGTGPDDPKLPINIPGPDDPGFEFMVPSDEVLAGLPVWIDPPIAVGYEYAVTGADAAAITLPPLSSVNDPDGYTVTVGATTIEAAPGEVVRFADAGLTGVQAFSVTGINEALALDPTDETAFALGITFANGSAGQSVTVSQVPITIDTAARAVPLPLWALLAAGIGFLVRGLMQGRVQRAERRMRR